MAYVFAVTANLSHLRITAPDSDYALPFVGLSIHAPAMNPGDEHFVFYSHGVLTVTVPVFQSNLVGATWQLRLQDLETNYLYLGFGGGGGGTVMSVNGGTGIIITGPAANPVVNLANTTVVAGSYTNMSATVDAQGRLTAASSGTAPVTAVNVAAPITTTGGTTPTIGHAASGAVAGAYTNANITVNASGHITAAANGTAAVTTIGTLQTTGTADALSISGTAIRAHVGTSSTPGVGHIQTWRGASNIAIGEGCFSNYATAVSNGRNTGCGYNALGTAGTISAATDSAAFGSYALEKLTNGIYNTATGSFTLQNVTTGLGNTAGGSYALNVMTTTNYNTAYGYTAGQNLTGSNNTLIGANAGRGISGNYSGNTAVGYNTLNINAVAVSDLTAVGNNALSRVTTGGAVAVGANAGLNLTTAVACTLVGQNAGQAITTGGLNTALGHAALSTISTADGCTAVGGSALQLATGARNTALGYNAGNAISTGTNNVMLGMGTGTTLTSGSDCICIGYQANVNATSRKNCLVIGSNAFSAGNNSTVLSLDYLQTTAGGLQALQIDSVTGEIRRNTSSMRYKNPLPDPPVGVFAKRLLDLQPRAFSMKNDPSNRRCIGYYAEEVEAIRGPLGNPVFGNCLSYTMIDDESLPQVEVTKTRTLEDGTQEEYIELEYQKTRAVDGVSYPSFVVPLIALVKIQQEQIDSLLARVAALEAAP